MEIVKKFFYKGRYISLSEVRDLHDSISKYLWEFPTTLAELYRLYACGICGYAMYYISLITRKYSISESNEIIKACNHYGSYNRPIPYITPTYTQLTLF